MPSENKKQKKQLNESPILPLDNIWHKAVSKNSAEREDGRGGLELLYLLFEDTLELKATEGIDPLLDVVHEVVKPVQTIEQFEILWAARRPKLKAIV